MNAGVKTILRVIDPSWRYVERVSALLEKALSPGSRVDLDVRLPVLNSRKGKRRQCDVVITTGSPPREMRTIVEVQKRKGKPDITTFDGWVQKMRDVGAQGLICVSEAGYPDSVIEKVNFQIGPTVRLMTLRELESNRI